MADILLKQGSIVSRDQYLNCPRRAYTFTSSHSCKACCMLVTPHDFKQDDIHLLQSLAEAFSTAYARYEDFNKLEAAKQQVDQALVELEANATTISSIRKDGLTW